MFGNGRRLCELIKDFKKHDDKQDEHNEDQDKRFVKIELKLIEFPKPEAYGKQSNHIQSLDKKVIAISTRQKVYGAIIMVILTAIIGSVFWIFRTSIAKAEVEQISTNPYCSCQDTNICVCHTDWCSCVVCRTMDK